MSEIIFQDVGIYMYDIKDYLSKKIITRWSILEGKGGGGGRQSSPQEPLVKIGIHLVTRIIMLL